jgi:uncharacterized membrane protein (DUF4010 family)
MIIEVGCIRFRVYRDMQETSSAFPPIEIASKLLLSLGIGLLVDLEREWSHKDLGVRTFAIMSLFGMLAALISPQFILVGLIGVVALLVVVNVGALSNKSPLETTTSGALLVTFGLGVLVGQGHIFTPTASAIVMTLLLALKLQLSRFAGGLTQAEVRGAVLLGLIGFVIYPVLPNRFVDPWRLVNPREAWLTVILIATIGFLNYILLRLYGARGLYYSAVFGGLVNSTAAIAELSPAVAAAGSGSRQLAIVVNLLTVAPMFLRNLALLLIFSPQAGLIAAAPVILMALIAIFFIWREGSATANSAGLELGSPISLRRLVSFGAIFIVIQAAASLGQRILGAYGIVTVSALGGLASSASSTAAVATLSRHGEVAPVIAALSTVLACVASTLVNLPILYRATLVRSAPPVDLVGSLFEAYGTALYPRPDIVLGVPLVLYGSGYPGGKIFNSAAFTAAPPGQQGNFGRNVLRGFDATQADLGLQRTFPTTEKTALRLGGEFFNVLNHPNFGSPTNSLTSPLFGRSTETLASSLGSGGANGGFNPLYQIGGPRSVQLALKLLF